MGAHNIELVLHTKATRDEITEAFKAQREDDERENGRASGYSGDFQTVNKVDFHLDKVFPNESDAQEYCLEKAVKWETVVAVYFNEGKPVKNKTVDKLNAKIKILSDEYHKLINVPLDKPKPFKTCGTCKSRLATERLTRHSCPLCTASLRPKAMQNKINSLKVKIDQSYTKISEIVNKEQEKQAAKAKNVKTLVAGWGAC